MPTRQSANKQYDMECRPLSAVVLLELKNPISKSYADNLATILDLPLMVYGGCRNLPDWARDSVELQREQALRIQEEKPGAEIICTPNDYPESLIVSNRLAKVETSGRNRNGLIVLAPHLQKEFDPYGKKRILVPFGRIKTCIKALCYALPIAQATGSSIELFHTPLPIDECDSQDWCDHMNETAKEMMEVACAICDENGVSHHVDVTSYYPVAVSEGIAYSAYGNHCNLVVMAISDDAVFGSHAHSILKTCLIPTIIIE